MRRLKRLFSILVMLVVMVPNIAYAREVNWGEIETPSKISTRLSEKILKSQDINNVQRRGRILSTAMLTITNEQDGTLYITVNTLAHKNVDKIYQTVFLISGMKRKKTGYKLDIGNSFGAKKRKVMVNYHHIRLN